MRKMYIQPKLEISNVALVNVVCSFSSGNGGNTSDLGGGTGGKTTGDAPKRRTEVF